MKKMSVVIATMCILAGLGATSVFGNRSGQDGGEGNCAIYVAPGVIAVDAKCTWVTIHTNVPFDMVVVDGTSVIVDGTEIKNPATFKDDLGNLVARVSFAEVVKVVASPSAEVVLTLQMIEEYPEDTLSASKTVPVKG